MPIRSSESTELSPPPGSKWGSRSVSFSPASSRYSCPMLGKLVTGTTEKARAGDRDGLGRHMGWSRYNVILYSTNSQYNVLLHLILYQTITNTIILQQTVATNMRHNKFYFQGFFLPKQNVFFSQWWGRDLDVCIRRGPEITHLGVFIDSHFTVQIFFFK